MQAYEEVIMITRKRSTKRPRLALTMATASSSTSGGSTSNEFSDRLTLSSSDYGAILVHEEEEDMANCLILLARGSTSVATTTYQCKTCDRSFPSFQALGGHRASHGKPNNKPATSTTVDDVIKEKQEDYRPNGCDDHNSLHVPNKSRVHECLICGAEFASGQALGGHMRRHRPITRRRNILLVDLNLPAPEDAVESNKITFAPKEQVAIFKASPLLVDCHY